MAWSDLPPERRALSRAILFFVVIVIISIVWNTADETSGALITGRDILMGLVGGAIYAGLMYVADKRLIRRKGVATDNDDK
jgi:hypothetical protein